MTNVSPVRGSEGLGQSQRSCELSNTRDAQPWTGWALSNLLEVGYALTINGAMVQCVGSPVGGGRLNAEHEKGSLLEIC